MEDFKALKEKYGLETIRDALVKRRVDRLVSMPRIEMFQVLTSLLRHQQDGYDNMTETELEVLAMNEFQTPLSLIRYIEEMK